MNEILITYYNFRGKVLPELDDNWWADFCASAVEKQRLPSDVVRDLSQELTDNLIFGQRDRGEFSRTDNKDGAYVRPGPGEIAGQAMAPAEVQKLKDLHRTAKPNFPDPLL